MTKNDYFNNGISLRQLIIQSEKIAEYAERDLELLQKHGVTAPLIADLKARASALEEKSTHGDDLSLQKVLTVQRNASIKEVTESIDILRKQLSLIFSKETGRNDALFTRAMSTLTVDDFVNLADGTLNAIKKSASEIEIYGVTAEMISDFESQVENLKAVHGVQFREVAAFSNSTKERSELREELFKLMHYIANIGRAYWKKKNLTVSKNYVIRKKSVSIPKTEDTDEEF